MVQESREIPISQLTLLEHNPRKITANQMKKLCDSLKNDPTFLLVRPVLVNEVDGKLIVYAGNQRVRAAKRLKWKTINCSISKDLPEDVIKERIIKDNKTYGEFDFDMLANMFEVDLLIHSGFTPAELQLAPIDEILPEDDEEAEKPLKCKLCPSCGMEL